MSKKLIALLLCLCMAFACIPAVCASGAESLEDALAAAKPGTTVTLQEDTTAAQVVVPKGVLLDLNGHTLTSDFFVVVNGQLFDSISLRLCRLTRLMCRSKSPFRISLAMTYCSKVGTVHE